MQHQQQQPPQQQQQQPQQQHLSAPISPSSLQNQRQSPVLGPPQINVPVTRIQHHSSQQQQHVSGISSPTWHSPAYRPAANNNNNIGINCLSVAPATPSTSKTASVSSGLSSSSSTSSVINANSNKSQPLAGSGTGGGSGGTSYPVNLGVLTHEDNVQYITDSVTDIGRNSSTSSVHLCVGKNSFVSRRHFQILYDQQSADFYLICLSKNGIFINDVLQRKSTEPTKLPKTCTFRFPSTEIRIVFESFSDLTSKAIDAKQFSAKSDDNTNVIYSPLKITIPRTEPKSPYPSPTGTISAANSCPTSPRQGFPDYHTYNYNNNNNKFQNEFQQPSTSNYNDFEKPPFSYAQLIVQSISASQDKQLTLAGIYSFISHNYPYYRQETNKGWQNSIRHNLSLNRYFIKVARSQDEPGKGSFWRIDPNSEAKLIEQSYKKRRQRGSQCFRPPYGMPRSAPVSPSHIDNSRENSPLQDVVLQSAPGSPGVSYQNIAHSDNHPGAEDLNPYTQNIAQTSSYSSHNQYNIPTCYQQPQHIIVTSTVTSTPASSIITSTRGPKHDGSGGVSSSTSAGGLSLHQSTAISNNSGGGGSNSTGSLKRHHISSSSSSTPASILASSGSNIINTTSAGGVNSNNSINLKPNLTTSHMSSNTNNNNSNNKITLIAGPGISNIKITANSSANSTTNSSAIIEMHDDIQDFNTSADSDDGAPTDKLKRQKFSNDSN